MSAWSACAHASTTGMAERGIERRHRRPDLREDGRVRELRLPREPLGVVRLPRVRVVVDQAALARGVLRGAAQRAADGLLLAAHPRAGRAPPRRDRAHARHQRERRAGDVGAVRGVAQRCGSASRHRLGASRRHRPRPRPSPKVARTRAWKTSPDARVRRSPVLEALATAGAFGCFDDATGDGR